MHVLQLSSAQLTSVNVGETTSSWSANSVGFGIEGSGVLHMSCRIRRTTYVLRLGIPKESSTTPYLGYLKLKRSLGPLGL